MTEPLAILPSNTVLHGYCVEVMSRLPVSSIDFVLTDPPYLVRFRDRSGRNVRNDDNADWLKPAFAAMHRVLKPDALCVSFYAWNRVEVFAEAWRAAGFRIVGHVVFRKRYPSSSRFMAYHHEQAYLLAKGNPLPQGQPVPDVIDWRYTGNKLHPTQKPVASLVPLIDAFCPPGGIVLDPFCGSGSTLVAAKGRGRRYLGIELDAEHHDTASQRLGGIPAYPEAA
jgi:site-specific DNA-methyltransferase (adenine-specific)